MVERKGVDFLFESMKNEFKEEEKEEGIRTTLMRDCINKSKSDKQRLVVWSPRASAVLWYLKHTIPMFSISDECRNLLEEGLKKKYPDIYSAMEDGI